MHGIGNQMIKNNPEFRAAYEKAVEDRADRLAEEIIELSDKELPDGLEGSMASAWVQQKRLQVEARKWVASKLKPKTYGDRIDVAVTDHRISVMDALNQAKQRLLNDESNVMDVDVKQAWCSICARNLYKYAHAHAWRKNNEKKARQQEKYRLLYTIIIMLSWP